MAMNASEAREVMRDSMAEICGPKPSEGQIRGQGRLQWRNCEWFSTSGVSAGAEIG